MTKIADTTSSPALVTSVRLLARFSACAISLCGLGSWSAAQAQPAPVVTLVEKVGLDQRLDVQVPLELPLVDEAGKSVRLGDFFGEKPVVLVLAYYRCPMLCTEVLNGLLKSSQAVPFRLAADYQIVTVSIDRRETPELAAAKKRRYVEMYRRDGATAGWHFLTGPQDSIDRLTQAVGYRYQYDAATDQFAHASGIILLTPTGKTSRYLFGVEYPPDTLRLGLVESGQGKIGSLVDQVLLLCYHYDPRTGRYGLVIHKVLRGLASVAALALGLFLYRMFRAERARSRAWAAASATGSWSADVNPRN